MAGPQRAPATAARPGPLRCIILAVLALVVVVGLVILIIWLVVRPSPIEYTVEKAQISGYNLTSSNNLNATFDLSLQANNHNKHVSVYYDSVVVSVWYSDQMVASSDVSPFHQPTRNSTVMDARPAAAAVPLVSGAAKNLKRERSAGVANLEVRVVARVRFKFGAIKSRHYTLKVDCSPVLVHFGSGKFERVPCDVDI